MTDGQTHTAVPTTVSTRCRTATAVPVTSQATLPILALTHEGRTIEVRRYEGCWTPNSSSDLQCVENSPRGVQGKYTDVESGDSIEIKITPESRPTRLMATVFAQLWEVMVSDLLHLSPIEREFVVDMPPGRYNFGLHAQWFECESDVQHLFGIAVPGKMGLESQCVSTAQGGIPRILPEPPDDRDCTALATADNRIPWRTTINRVGTAGAHGADDRSGASISTGTSMSSMVSRREVSGASSS